MIKFENRFDEYAYRVATLELDPSVQTLEEGQFVTVKDGKLILANKTDKKAFIATGSHRVGRDQIAGKAVKKVAFLVGASILTITNFNAGETYGDMTPLTVDKGVVTPKKAETDLIVGYSLAKPVSGGLRILVQA